MSATCTSTQPLNGTSSTEYTVGKWICHLLFAAAFSPSLVWAARFLT